MRGLEAEARETIDQLLEAAGWVLQDRAEFDRTASLGVAVREFQLPAGPCDYLLFVDSKAAGVIEAKKAGVTLSGVADQSDKYMQKLPDHMHARWDDILIYDYESTGEETFFRNLRDPKPRSRRLFAFHQPVTLHQWLLQTPTLRARLRSMPPLVKTGLRDCQVEAIEGLERSLADDKPRALIQLATGAGKTFTACSFSYRLIKEAGAKRILFLVDRNNLGDQTLKEFQNFHPPGAANRFTDTYIVQHLHSHRLDPDAKVVITTIQRLYSMLRGKELATEDEEESAFEKWSAADDEQAPIEYNPDIPIETFDFIVTDECHRSIYGLWRQVLEYFDAYIIGLTATPSKHTLGFFNQNLVAEYPYERSVADGVNVGYEVYRIRTRVTEQGATLEGKPGFPIPFRDKRTRKVRYEELDADLEYTGGDLDRSVVNPNQIRTVLQTYKDRVFTELFTDRTGEWLPKTLIFAKDDAHAEEIVQQAREVFGEGNDFAKKITYRNTGESPKELIKAFRVDPFPRIAVTVDMIATGTDIKPVEVLIFMRDVKSEGYYEQMKGRGVRTIPDADLKAVTPDAQTKTRFILIDAVGVSETKKNASQPLERKKGVSFEALLEQIAMGRRDEDAMSSLAARLAALDRKLGDEDRRRIAEATGGKSPRDLANALLDAIDPDKQAEVITAAHGSMASHEQEDAVVKQLAETACRPFDKPAVRNLLKDIKAKTDIVIDEITTDEVLSADFDLKRSEETITSFKQFIEDNRDELTALQILYNQPLGKQRLTYAAIRELVTAMSDKPPYLTAATVWQAYKRLNAKSVRGAPVDEQLTEVVSLVRFALGQVDVLEPFGSVVEQRFNLWLGRQKKAGRDYTTEQEEWLRMIASFIAANAEITPRDFMEAPSLSDKGGILTARKLFDSRFNETLDELQTALAA
jgi:type I restriction enzyme, R subunit